MHVVYNTLNTLCWVVVLRSSVCVLVRAVFVVYPSAAYKLIKQAVRVRTLNALSCVYALLLLAGLCFAARLYTLVC